MVDRTSEWKLQLHRDEIYCSMIQDMIEILLSDGPRNDMVMQGCFDFLSTIMRGNPEAFTRCERAIDCTANVSLLDCGYI